MGHAEPLGDFSEQPAKMSARLGMEILFIEYLREQARALETIARSCNDTKTVTKLRTMQSEFQEKAVLYEELLAAKRGQWG
jgi:hypothetical protein